MPIGEDSMKVIKKDVTTEKSNAENERTAFRLCGQTPIKMLVNKDLVPQVAFQAEILPHADQEHQLHHQKHLQLHQHNHASRLLQPL